MTPFPHVKAFLGTKFLWVLQVLFFLGGPCTSKGGTSMFNTLCFHKIDDKVGKVEGEVETSVICSGIPSERIVLYGRVVHRLTAQPVSATITIRFKKDGSNFEFTHKVNSLGEYQMYLERDITCEILVEGTDFEVFRYRLNTGALEGLETRMDFELEPIGSSGLRRDESENSVKGSIQQTIEVGQINDPVNPFLIQKGNPDVTASGDVEKDGIEAIPASGTDQVANQEAKKLKVFLDCDFCDLNDVKQNIQFVNYVRDKQDAEFHLLITRRNSGSGGEELTFFLSGLGQYSVAEDNYNIDIHAAATEAEMRNKILKGIQAGLLRQLVNSGAIDHITIGYTESGNTNSAPRNHWNNWVFDIGLSGYYARDAVYTERSLYTNLSAIRITEKWKTEFTTNGSFFYGTYKYGDDTYTAYNRIVNLKSLIVRTGGPRFSWGLRGMAEYSTFSNYALRLELFPSVEYNLYPYTESSRHQLSALYGIGLVHNNFLDTTIFNLMRQDLWGQNLSVAMKFIETWGNLTVGVSGISYLSNTDFYRVTLSSEALFRLYRGFNLQIRGGVSVIHDQFNLPKGGADFEQVLLQQREMLSSYYYWFVVGINFTFGDIYNSIVNPRFTQLF